MDLKEQAKQQWNQLPDLSQLIIEDVKVRLPKSGEKNYLITSALPYVNNVPHLGNIIGSTLSADVFTRYCRLRGINCIYICGTDEYGTATETKALEEGCTPKELTDKYFKIHKDVYEWFNIEFDLFDRTSTDNQTKICQDMFLKCHKNGYFFEKEVEQLFCENCKMFLADRYVEGICPHKECQFVDARGDQCDKCGKLLNPTDLKEPKCKVCKSSPVLRTSNHLYLDLPKLEPDVKKYFEEITSKPDSKWTNTAKIIAQSWLKEGLLARCMTRDLKWGTPVPLKGYENKVFYVWFDAPIGYLSITKTLTDEWEKWWKNPEEVELYQFMAKDNVPFHSIIFPAIQFGTKEKYTTINHLIGIEYLNYEDSKFSKSRGTGVFGNDAKNTDIPADIWRFYLLFIRPETQDTSFSWSDLQLKNNSELLNNLGNFVNRTLSFIAKNFDSQIGEIDLQDDDLQLIVDINKEIKEYCNVMDGVKLRDGIKNILSISRLGNGHMQATKPWDLLKSTDETDKKRALSILSLCANITALLSLLISPYMPTISQKLKNQLNLKQNMLKNDYFIKYLSAGHKIGEVFTLFKRIEQKQIDEYKKNFGGEPEKKEKKDKKKKDKKKDANVKGDNLEKKETENKTDNVDNK